jgi:hypothetical protein
MPRPYPSPPDPRPAPASGPNTTTLIAVGAGAVLLLVVACVVVFKVTSKPRRAGLAGNVPTNFFQQASADFAEAKRLLAEGRLSDSADKFAEAQIYRSRAGDKSVSATQNFEAWCAAREKEYRAAAAAAAPSLPERVAAGKSSVAEVDTFLERFGTDDARAAWQQQRPALEKGAATAAAAGAYRVEWLIQGADGSPIRDLTAGDFTALTDALSAKLRGARLLTEADAPGLPPEAWRGHVGVTLVYAEASYKETGVLGREAELRVPATLIANIEVITNKKKSRWDGVHEYAARVSPPKKLTDKEIAGARATLQRDLLAKVVGQISAAPAKPGATPADAEALDR